jgi:long-chain acyl-CoA synthetase
MPSNVGMNLFHPCHHAAATPDKPAFVMAETGHVVTYGDLDRRSNQVAQMLRARGLKAGDHIAILLENQPRYFEVCWGAQRAGIIYTCVSTRLTVGEAAYILENSESKVLITSQACAALAGELRQQSQGQAQGVHTWLMMDGTAPGYDSYEEELERHPQTRIADETAGTDMLYSSGTTGRPKGVFVPPDTPAIDATNSLIDICRGVYGISPATVYLSPAPLYHAAPLRFNMTVQRLGGTCVVMEHFDPETYLQLLQRYRATHTQLVPTMFVRMLKLPPEVRQKYDVSSLKFAIHAAAPCPVPVKEQMIDWWGPVIWEYYAGTEGNGMTLVHSKDWLTHKGTVGKAVVGKLKICDEHGLEVPTRTEGTIYFADGRPFSYHKDDKKTSESTNAAGWTTLGDVGYADEEGYLYLTDRKAHMIISGGVNIYPQEAENLLVTHPKVLDVAVIGVPNEDFGEEVKAVVQPRDMAEAGPALAQELIEFCRASLSPIKCPRTVDFEAELPRHPTGKLYKRLLRDRYWAGRASRLV